MRKYQPSDFKEINGWFLNQKGIPLKENLLPHLGYIEPGIAVGFLYQTDAPICFLEPFIANPDRSQEERNAALENIMGSLLESAREKNSHVFGVSTSPTMIRRALKLGFHIQDISKVLVKEFK